MQNYNLTFRNYLNEHPGDHLIFYLSEETLIRRGRSFKPEPSLKKCKVGTS